MRILCGCEFSGRLRTAFRNRGHDAWSCDLLPAEDGSPFHLQCDVLSVLSDGWDLATFNPDCTYLTISAEWAYGPGPYHQRVKPGTLTGAARLAARDLAIDFVQTLFDAPIEKIAIENPIGVLTRALELKPQIIQPHQFGEDASKATCLWLKNLPELVPTAHVAPRLVVGADGKARKRWANQTDSGQNKLSPSADRWKDRSRTYQGIADAFAAQWG